MRRLPVYPVIDTPGSMRGESIHSVNVRIQAMPSALRQDPYALKSVYISTTTYDNEVCEFTLLMPLEDFQFSNTVVPSVGGTFTGAVLECLMQYVEQDVRRSDGDTKGDWRPLVFLMTDGTPPDALAYGEAVKAIRGRGLGSIVACAIGPKAGHEHLKQFTDKTVSLETLDSTAFAGFFEWVSASASSGNTSAGINNGTDTLPPPSPETQLVL